MTQEKDNTPPDPLQLYDADGNPAGRLTPEQYQAETEEWDEEYGCLKCTANLYRAAKAQRSCAEGRGRSKAKTSRGN